MRILAIDTSSPRVSVAVMDAERVLSECAEPGNASVLLLPSIQRALREAGCTLDSIEAVALGEGPGSYNGLRCGFALATGLLLPNPRPAVQVPSLAAMALAHRRQNPSPKVGIVLNARKNSLFFARYRFPNGLPELENEGLVEGPEQIPGNGSPDIEWLSYEVEGFRTAHPEASAVGLLAVPLLKTGRVPSVLEPRYLRPPV